jgi:hypothetical protein
MICHILRTFERGRLPTAPSTDAPKTTIEVTISQAEAGVMNPSEDSDDIDIEENITTIRPAKAKSRELR